MAFLKKLILWGAIAGTIFFFLSYHIIYIDKSIKLLKKSKLSLEYTFYSASLSDTGTIRSIDNSREDAIRDFQVKKENRTILSIDNLREAGVGDLLVEMGRMSQEEMESLVAQIEGEAEY